MKNNYQVHDIKKLSKASDNTVRDITRQRASWSDRAGSTLEKDSGHEIKEKDFISEVSTTIFNDFIRCRRFSYIHAEGSSLGSTRTPSAPSLHFAGNHLYLRFGSIFGHK